MNKFKERNYKYVCRLKDEYAQSYGFDNWKHFYSEYAFQDSFRINHALDTISIEIINTFYNDKAMSELLKLNKSDVISSVCTCRNSELEKDSLVPVYCRNCNAYVQTDL